MQDKQFDEFFRNKMSGYPSPVPEDMWEKVKPAAPKSKRRLILWIWVLLAGTLLSGGVFLTYQKHHDKAAVLFSQHQDSVAQRTKPATALNERQQHPTTIPSRDTVVTDKPTSSPGHNSSRLPEYIPGNKNSTEQNDVSDFPNVYDNETVDTNADDTAASDTAIDGQVFAGPTKGITDSTENKPEDAPTRPERGANQPLTSKWFAELYAGPTIGFTSVSKKTSYPSVSAGKSDVSLGGGIYIGKFIGKHLLIKTGLMYTQIKNESRDDSVLIALRPLKFSSVDIPVIAGYSSGTGKLRWNLNVGAIVNVYSQQDGALVDSMEVVDAGASGYYKNWSGIKGYAGISALYIVCHKLQVYGEPYFVYQFADMSARRNYFSQKTHVAGIAVGIRYSIPDRQRH